MVHAAMYGAFALSHYLAYAERRWIFGVMIVVPSLWGILFEWLQNYVPMRSVSVWDAVANVLGACCMTLVVYLWNKRK